MLFRHVAPVVPWSLCFESNIFNMIVDIAFPEEKLAHSPEKSPVELKTNMGLMKWGSIFSPVTVPAVGLKHYGLAPSSWALLPVLGPSVFYLTCICLDQKLYRALHWESELYLSCFIHSLPGLTFLTLLQAATCKLEQVTDTSNSDYSLRNLTALCWAAFTAVPGHLCVSVISSSSRTKCVRGFNKLMLVKCRPVVGMWVRDAVSSA